MHHQDQRVNAFLAGLAALGNNPRIDLPDVYGDTWTRCLQAIEAEITSWGKGPAVHARAIAGDADSEIEHMNLSDDLTWAASQAVRAILVWDRESTAVASREVYRPFEKVVPNASLSAGLSNVPGNKP